MQVRVLNLQGQLLIYTQQQKIGEEIRLPVAKLTAGMYFIQMRSGQGIFWMDKFVKK